jgi:hypothetical protein
MKAQAAEGDGVLLVETPYGSGLYCQALALREAVLRQPLGLSLTEDELADDALRRHFCATLQGEVVGSVSLRPLDSGTVQLRQMAVAETDGGRGSERVCLPAPKTGRAAKATASSCSMPGSAPMASTRRMATLRKASRSRRTPFRMSE